MDPDKMSAVEAIKAPETKKQVRQTMGFSTTSGRVFPIILVPSQNRAPT